MIPLIRMQNRMNMENPHAHMRESTESTSASSLSLLRQIDISQLNILFSNNYYAHYQVVLNVGD